MESGITVSTWDPYLSAEDIPNSIEVIDEINAASGFDMVVLATAHNECMNIDWQSLCARMRTPILYDGRRVLDLNEMKNMGWKANAVGSPKQH
jgi:UDP-N-acetyl-D-mannosaminuronate dehydrogenase